MAHSSAKPMVELPPGEDSPKKRLERPGEAEFLLDDDKFPVEPVDEQDSENPREHPAAESDLNSDEANWRQFHRSDNYTCPDIHCRHLLTSFETLHGFLKHLDRKHSDIMARISHYYRLGSLGPLEFLPLDDRPVRITSSIFDQSNDSPDPDGNSRPESEPGSPSMDPVSYGRQPRAKSNRVFIPNDVTYASHSVRAKSNSVFIPNDVTYGAHSSRPQSNSVYVPNDYPALTLSTGNFADYHDRGPAGPDSFSLAWHALENIRVQMQNVPKETRQPPSRTLGRRRSTDIINPGSLS
jgi:hypothetical protein